MPARPVVIIGNLVFTDSESQPPGIWGPPGPWPSPPIYFPPAWGGERPPGIWGGGNVPMPTPPIANAPGVGPNPNPPGWGMRPEHPIFYPPGIWGGGNQPFPTPPIPIYPGGTPNPPNIWGPNDPRPTPPIHIPKPPEEVGEGGVVENPINKPPSEAPEGYDWRFVYVPFFGGWAWVLVPESKSGAGSQDKSQNSQWSGQPHAPDEPA